MRAMKEIGKRRDEKKLVNLPDVVMNLEEQDTWTDELPWNDDAERVADGPLDTVMLKQVKDEEMRRYAVYNTVEKFNGDTWTSKIVDTRGCKAIPDDINYCRKAVQHRHTAGSVLVYGSHQNHGFVRHPNWYDVDVDAESAL